MFKVINGIEKKLFFSLKKCIAERIKIISLIYSGFLLILNYELIIIIIKGQLTSH
jgi:hypothetical protein